MKKNSNKNINELFVFMDNDFNFISEDVDIINNDIMPLDSRVKPENDKERALRHENDNLALFSCHSRAQIRESSRKMNRCFSGYSCQNTNMTRMISQSSRIFQPVTLGRSETKTQEFRAKTAFMPKAFRFSECGRSMVEMLGTLAIIGVLSIGGIMGYSYGMDKYRANETINDVNMRMMDLMMWLNNHSDAEPVLSNTWGKSGTFYPMDFVFDDETSEYALEVSEVSKQVCEMVSDALISSYSIEVGSNRYIGSISDNLCKEKNIMAFYLDGGDKEKCGNIICSACQKCDTMTQTCVNTTNYRNRCTVSIEDNVSGWCVEGSCQTDPETCKCDENQYCSDTNESDIETHPGECKELDFTKYIIEYTDENGFEQIETWYKSNNPISWWDTKSACKAMGKKLPADPSEFLIDYNGGIFKTYTPNKRLEALKNIIGGYTCWTEKTSSQNAAYMIRNDGYVLNDTNGSHDGNDCGLCY